MIDVVQAMNLNKINWLDTGWGTGKTARKALEELGEMDIDFTLCDISNEMLGIAKDILGDNGIIYRNISSQEIELLKSSGFKCVEILWFSYMQAGFLAIK